MPVSRWIAAASLQNTVELKLEPPFGDMPNWLAAMVTLASAAIVGFIVALVVLWVVLRFAKRLHWKKTPIVIRRLRAPLLCFLPCMVMQLAMPSMTQIPEATRRAISHGIGLLVIATLAWLFFALVNGCSRFVRDEFSIDVSDNYEARRIHTQVAVLERALEVLIIAVALGVALMTFPRIRELGTSILASAGIAGLIIGLAARPVLENLIAGIQIAITRPINIDDVVIIEGEWGRIEQITGTYIVVRIWDDRRLIVPFSKFISEPFQNWTRRTADILGTVFVYTDYTVPVEEVRGELRRIVEQSHHWDKRVCVLQVTDATERSMQLRALVSASNSSAAWDLRVFVREKLIEYLQREHPGCLPRLRLMRDEDDAGRHASDER